MERATEPAQVRPRAVGRFELGPWIDAGGTTTAAAAAADAADRRSTLPRPPAQDAPRLADAARGPVQREAVLAPALAAVMPATPPGPETPPRSAVVRAPTRSERRASAPVPEVVAAGPAPATPEPPAGVARRRLQPEAVRLAALLPVRPAPERRAPSATPDVVQVRIGRVEVRATMAREERPQVSRAPRARPLSLEAFLAGKRLP